MLRPAIIALLVVAATGCASLTSPARVHKLEAGSSYWFDYEGSRRGMILVAVADAKGGAVIRSCAEPSPDVALALEASGRASGSYQGADAGVAAGGRQIIDRLGERTQMVMFFREALFRVCEMSLNQNLGTEQVAALYKDIIRTALLLGSNKALDIESTRAQRELELTLIEKAKIDLSMRELELRIAAADQEKEKRQAQQALAALQEKSREIDSRVASQIGEISKLSQQSAENLVKAATDAAASSSPQGSPPATRQAPTP